MAKLTFNSVAREICKREVSESREVNITDVKRVIRHFFDVLADTYIEWHNDDQKMSYVRPHQQFLDSETMKRVEMKLIKRRKSKSRKAREVK